MRPLVSLNFFFDMFSTLRSSIAGIFRRIKPKMAQPAPTADEPGDAATANIISSDETVDALTNKLAEILDLDPRVAKDNGVVTMLRDSFMATHIQEEVMAKEDRRLALRAAEEIQRGPDADMNPLGNGNNSVLTELKSISRMAGLCGYDSAARSLLPDDSQNDRRPFRPTYECTACTDTKQWYKIHNGPCGHAFCDECLVTLFQDSYKDESLFAPRCCHQNFNVDDPELRILLTRTIIDRYALRKIEVETTDRTYCHQCEEFLPPSAISDDVATCPSCQSTSCSRCKRASHAGTCARDEAQEQVLAIAAEEGWQRCPGCQTMVELNQGCFHMTCRCGHEFCYLCAARWKTCQCRQWDEARLFARAAQIVDRDPNPPRARVEREARVRQVAQEQEEAHNCTHPYRGWRKVDGRHRCEECHHWLREYIFECRQCHLRACWRCRRHRL